MEAQTIIGIVIVAIVVIVFIIWLAWQIKKKGLKQFATEMIVCAAISTALFSPLNSMI